MIVSALYRKIGFKEQQRGCFWPPKPALYINVQV